MLKAIYMSYYYKAGTDGKPARPMFMYLISGKAEHLETYTEILDEQGITPPVEENSGKMIFFSITPLGRELTINFSHNPQTDTKRIIVKDDELAGLTALLNVETDPTVKAQFAQEMAQTKLARMRSMLDVSNKTTREAAVAPVAQTEAEPVSAETELSPEDVAELGG